MNSVMQFIVYYHQINQLSVQHAPLPLAETASVFGEMLLNDKISNKVSDKERKILLAEQIDDFYATIMRQTYFTIFEVSAHEMISKNNATTIDEFNGSLFKQFKRTIWRFDQGIRRFQI